MGTVDETARCDACAPTARQRWICIRPFTLRGADVRLEYLDQWDAGQPV